MYLDMIQGKDEIAGTDLQKIKIGIDVYREGSEKLNKASILLYNWQERLFFLVFYSLLSGVLLKWPISESK